MQRNSVIDNMRGLGILLMVLGHSSIPFPLYKIIFTFHMPLFFLLSGYLYKERPLREIVRHNYEKVLKPYMWCLLLCTPICLYFYKGDWLLTCLFTKNVPMICGFDWNGQIGPLWFLLAYFVSSILLWAVKRIGKKYIEVGVLLLLFELMIFIIMKWNSVLPFQLSQATGCALFAYIGSLGKAWFKSVKRWWLVVLISALLFIPISYFGYLSMASMDYKLNVLQLLGGLSGTVLLYSFVRFAKIERTAWIGRNAMPILCFHSIDYHYRGGLKSHHLYVIMLGFLTV